MVWQLLLVCQETPHCEFLGCSIRHFSPTKSISTSPSVYAKFYNIIARDSCGASTVAETMLAFSPGELSTLAGHYQEGNFYLSSFSTNQFDFGDLPCRTF